MRIIIASDTNFEMISDGYSFSENQDEIKFDIIRSSSFPLFLLGNFDQYFSNIELSQNERNVLVIFASYETVEKSNFKVENLKFFKKISKLEKYFDLVLISEFSSVGKFYEFIPTSYFSEQTLGTRILLMNSSVIKLLQSSNTMFMIPTTFLNPKNDKKRQRLIKTTNSYMFPDEFREFSENIVLASRSYFEQPFKVIALDLDNTLWGGVIGDDGIESLRIGGHDHIGEYYSEFQKCLKVLKDSGFLLVILSKNNSDIALNVFNKHPDMVLKIDDFADYEINWEEKHENIVKISERLSLNLNSFIFIDDNPVERLKMSSNLPQVNVFNFPEQLFQLHEKLNSEPRLSKYKVTNEDTNRTQMYMEEKNRKEFLTDKKTIKKSDIAKLINLEISYHDIVDQNVSRACQLINRTNQFSLQGRKYSQDEFNNKIKQNGISGFVVRAKDDFGDYGIISSILFQITKQKIVVFEFSMSCRILGRSIENNILEKLKTLASSKDKQLEFSFIDTGLNSVINKFLSDNSANISPTVQK